MLQRTLGEIPRPHPTKLCTENKIEQDLSFCAGPRVGGDILVDATGIGKTETTLLFLNLLPLHLNKSDGDYMPTLLLCPSLPVISQWVEEVIKHFPVLEIIVAFGERAQTLLFS